MNLPIYGQRDSRWKDILLGYNTSAPYTIGGYGCLITAFAMYLKSIGKDETPATVNEKIKALTDSEGKPNGFVNGGDLVWASMERVWGIKLVYQSPYYSGPVTSQGKTKMKALLDERRPLICHVDFDPNDSDDDMHWVLVTDYDGDNFYCNDPWTGTHVNVDVYGGSIERAVLEFRAYDPIVPETINVPTCETELNKCRVSRDSHWNDLMSIKDHLRLGGDYAITVVLAEIDKLIGYETLVIQKEKALSEAQQQIVDLKKQISDLTAEVYQTKLDAGSLKDSMAKEMSDMRSGYEDKITKLQDTIVTQSNKLENFSTQLTTLQKSCQQKQLTGWRLKLYNFIMK